MNELAVVVDLARKVGVVLARGFEHDLGGVSRNNGGIEVGRPSSHS
jgi:hypothetical protein